MNKTTLNQDQSGLVSIMVTMVMMLLVTLLVLSFSQIIRREQRQVLDRQLNTQAFYAAESGINIAVNELLHNVPGPITSPNDTDDDCSTTSNLNAALDPAGKVKVSCISVDASVPNLVYDGVDSHAQIAPLNASGTIDSITVVWQETGASNTNVNCTQANGLRSVSPDWTCPAGLLRVDLVPTPGGALTRATMQANQFTAFLYPSTVGSITKTYASGVGGNQGSITKTTCTSSPVICTMKITNLPVAASSYTVKVQSFYQKSKVTLSAADNLGTGLTLTGAQAIIDATGKAVDVLRRIQVRVPLQTSAVAAPDFGLQAVDGLCKRYLVTPNVTVSLDTPASLVDTTGDCQSDTVGGLVPTVPPGDGYAAIFAAGKIFNMFHHREGLYIVCNNTDLTPCGYDTEATPTPIYLTPQHSKMVDFGGRFYFPSQLMAGGATHGFGVGCFDYTAHVFCGFANLGTTGFVQVGGSGSPESDFSAGIDNIVLVGNQLYTIAIDAAGNEKVYCADPTPGTPVACAGFVPYSIGVTMANNTQGQFNIGFSAVGSKIFFNANNLSGVHVGCYDTATAASCWPALQILAGIDNITAVRVNNALCLADQGFSLTFTTKCFDTANGSIIAAPPNFLTGSKPLQGLVPGAFWANWETLYDGTKIYFTGVNRLGATGAGSIYCYDTATSNVCAGWGINGWSDGFAVLNDYSNFEPYAVIRAGACLYGIGDNPQTPPIFKLSPLNSGPC